MLNEVLPVLARLLEPGHGIDSLLDLIVSMPVRVAMEYDLPVALQSGTTALDEFGPGAGKGHAAYATSKLSGSDHNFLSTTTRVSLWRPP